MQEAQHAQQHTWNHKAQPCEFYPEDKVLPLVPCANSKFLEFWQGPYMVVERMRPVTYKVRQPGRQQMEQIYHVNLLKK